MVNTKRKFMKIEAYRLIVFDVEDVERENGELLDFDSFDKEFQKKKINNHTKLEHGLSMHTLNSINKIEQTKYELIFSKLDSTDYPIVVNNSGEISDMKDNISNDSRIGHITCGLYDDTYKVLLLQINFNAMTVSNIENYINKVFIKEDKVIKLIPLIDSGVFTKAKNGYKTKIDVSMHVEKEKTTDKKSSLLFKKYSEAQEMNAVNASFSFSMGHVRKDSLEEKQANQLLKDIEENMNIIGKAKVSYKEQLEDKITVADLLLQKLHAFIYFDIPERATLREETILREIKKNTTRALSTN
ncbi:hypothetical protein QVA46_00610 [Staphylococcus haemolyticus]|uniref:DUF6731 family protein n=1 Tax=Staphylococcus haemolyticus TaxID=1283 RepID=UPI001F3D58C1|nr:DUF6731 family protein [Staphylococcus haemolyticus]MCE4958846.1 hypothetical protein [Staphylococcus haemolyticus]MDU0448077.1 hypothetical protein [Staphylococcus haemolyticus]MDU0489490.1 hypothetical protein [Staphylococcus haemolyticus]